MTAPDRFQFDLQRVLDLRRQHEQAVAGRLGAASEAADEARRAMETLARLRQVDRADLARAHAPRSAGSVLQVERLLTNYDAHLAAAATELASREAVVDQVRDELHGAMQARRVISRLRDRREEEWRQGFVRAERAAMDALAIERHARRDDTMTREEG